MSVFENQTQAVPVNASISAEKGELSEAFTLKEEHGHANITGQTQGRSEVVYDLAGFPIKNESACPSRIEGHSGRTVHRCKTAFSRCFGRRLSPGDDKGWEKVSGRTSGN